MTTHLHRRRGNSGNTFDRRQIAHYEQLPDVGHGEVGLDDDTPRAIGLGTQMRTERRCSHPGSPENGPGCDSHPVGESHSVIIDLLDESAGDHLDPQLLELVAG